MSAKFWKSGYDVPCQIYTCTRPSAWMIGANPETLGMNLFLCQACAESLFESMLGSELARPVLERLAATAAVVPVSAPVMPAVISPPAGAEEPTPAAAPTKGKPVQPLRIPAPKDLALICPKCGKGPFKNKKGLLAHMKLAPNHGN